MHAGAAVHGWEAESDTRRDIGSHLRLLKMEVSRGVTSSIKLKVEGRLTEDRHRVQLGVVQTLLVQKRGGRDE